MRAAIFAFLCFFSLTAGSLTAQERLQGLFEGSLTLGGLESSRKVRMEMYLRFSGQEIVGRSYVHKGKGEVVEMELKGWLYGDFSVYLQEVKLIPQGKEAQPVAPVFRKYQMQYGGNFDEVVLVGFWQEETDQPLGEKREIGRVRLRKIRDSKA